MNNNEKNIDDMNAIVATIFVPLLAFSPIFVPPIQKYGKQCIIFLPIIALSTQHVNDATRTKNIMIPFNGCDFFAPAENNDAKRRKNIIETGKEYTPKKKYAKFSLVYPAGLCLMFKYF
jgi:hypothetical protein